MTGKILIYYEQQKQIPVKIKWRYQFYLVLLAVVIGAGNIQAQTTHFKVADQIPYLPVVEKTADVANPLPGAMVVERLTGGLPLIYNGTAWQSLCNAGVPELVNSIDWFRVVDGIPCLPIREDFLQTGPRGAMYYPSTGGGIKISNGNNWQTITDFNAGTDLTTSTEVKMGAIPQAEGSLQIPVLNAVPTVTDAGAFYIDAATADLQIYDGQQWLAIDCSNCPPQVRGVNIVGDFEKMSSNDFSDGGYAYYDKEEDPELPGPIYHWYLSTGDNGTGTLTELSNEQSYTYTYTDDDDGKYLNLGVTARANGGYPLSDETTRSVLLQNCPPQAVALNLNLPGTLFSSPGILPAAYAYYDKENNAEGNSLVKWFVAEDATGTGETQLGTGADYEFTFDDSYQGKYLRFKVTPVATTGYSTGDEKSSAYTQIFNCPPQVAGVSISGDFTKMTSDAFTFGGYAYYDKEGDPELLDGVEYRWFISDSENGGGTQIALSTSPDYTYNYQDEHNSKYLNIGVTAKASQGYSTSEETYASALLENCPPQAVGLNLNIASDRFSAPLVLPAAYAYYDKENNAEGSSQVQWYVANDEAGTGENLLGSGADYTFTYNDSYQGAYLRFKVTPIATTGYSTGDEVYSPYCRIFNCPPQVTGVLVAGITAVGETLAAGYAYYDKEGDAEQQTFFQWYRATDAAGSGKQAISGATGSSYQLTAADAGYYIGVEIRATTAAGYTTADLAEAYTNTAVGDN